MKFRLKGSDVRYWAMLNLGILLLSAGVYFFKAPNNFATGGVSGIAIVISKFITPKVSWLGRTELINIMNVLLLIIGFIFLGKGCTFKTAYCTLVYSGEMMLMELLPVKLPLTNELFIEFMFAMILTSAGSAIIFNCKASSGGTDIIALIIKKYTNVKNVGIAILLTDMFVAFSTFFVFNLETGLYSMLGLCTKAFFVDSVIDAITRSKCITIITSNPSLTSQYILESLHRGFTSYKAMGGYSKQEKTVLMAVCGRNEARKLKTKIHAVDPTAFVIVSDNSEIIGKGFSSV